MKCPNCGNELENGKLLCGKCGEDVKIVPDFDIELEAELKESISSMMEDMAFDEPGFDGGPKDEQRNCHLGEAVRIRRIKAAVIFLAAVLSAVGVIALVRHNISSYRYNSYDYQYGKAVEYASHGNYPEAVPCLERALTIAPGNLDAKFLLARYYDRNGQQQSAASLLEELAGIEAGLSKKDEVYDMLLGLYEAQGEYRKIGEALKSCEISRITEKYNKYSALKPTFNKQGGAYDKLISISLTGNTQGFVHYTLDGTAPTNNSPVYETPILLESGDYIIRAMFINIYGVESDIETQHYYISLSIPDSPVVDPESGSYAEPFLIEAFHDNNTKVYYTTDGTLPDSGSSRYMAPLEMPYGMSNFSFISINESGLRSEVVNRSYQLEIQANFDAELAVQILKNNLCAAGKLLDTEGHMPDKPGVSQYRIRTLYKSEEAVYYIVYEEYVDLLGQVHDTNNIYAVNADTADLCKAYKMDEGKYNLRPFAE